ncbi:hypothetical protein SHKM778_32360 [Streptomyces sp. KM77-8]|uniref:Uncharacterized protein n=1 Tax=Streptomyces haneummycinicus TaxID=3074435 RepID=A0AAT9HHR4_9ACTN
MCLDQVDVTGVQSRVGEGGAHHLLLGGAARRGDAVAGAVLVDGRALDEGEDLVAVAAGVGEPFQDEDTDAFGEAGAVGGGRERLADPVGARPRWRLKALKVPGPPMTATPPARARSDSPALSDRTARCRATREEEQAVSTVSVGPSRSRV